MNKVCISIVASIAVTLLAINNLGAAGKFSVKLINNTQDPNVKIYVLVKGLDPATKKPAFIKFATGTSIGEYAIPSAPDADINHAQESPKYSYELTFFQNADNEYVMHLPFLESGRIYLSLDKKLNMPVVGEVPNLGIADPNPFNKSEPNYEVLYDKVEFTYISLPNGFSQTVINPTAVDCLALPIAVSQDKLVQGKVENVLYGITDSREKTFKDIEAILKGSENSAEWERLIIRSGDGKTILRIVAPGRDDAFFNKNYLNDYIAALWNYYKSHELTVDCSELTNLLPGLGSYIFSGKVQDDGWVFTNATKSSIVTIKKPESKNFFLAAQGAFDAPNNTVEAVIIRNLCAAWSIGMLPAPTIQLASGTSTNMLNKDYFIYQKDHQQFYKNNSIIPTTGTHRPWYNLYAKAIHAVSKDIYAWAYDDAIGLDGTNFSTDVYPATLTVGPMKG